MADWDSEDLLARFLEEAGIEDTHEEADAVFYRRLADAQHEVIREIAARYPDALYRQEPTALTPSADRKTFTFGTDPADPTRTTIPIGRVQISPHRSAFIGDGAYFWQKDREFLDEGDRIRIVGDRAYAGTLYARWVPRAPSIAEDVEPVLPVDLRDLILIRATENYATAGNQNPALADVMRGKWARRFPEAMLFLRKRFRAGGALGDPAQWYLTSPDLGRSS